MGSEKPKIPRTNDEKEIRRWRAALLDYTSSSGIVHGTLGGLSADDHTQYLLVNGTRSLGGNWSLGNFNLTSVGNITGTDVDLSLGTGTITTSGIINADGGITSDNVTDTAWGIQNQNLVDKTAAESISNIWTWTSGGITLNNNIPFQLGTGGNDIVTITPSAGSPGTLNLAMGSDMDFAIDTSVFFYDKSQGSIGIGTATPDTYKIDVLLPNTATLTKVMQLRAVQSTNNVVQGIQNIVTFTDESNVEGFNNQIIFDNDNNTNAQGFGGKTIMKFKNDSGGAIVSTMQSKALQITMQLETQHVDDLTIKQGRGINFISTNGGGGKVVMTDNYRHININDLASDFEPVDLAGIWIVNQIRGTSNNYGIVLDGDKDGSDIVFGAGRDDRIEHDGTYLFVDCVSGFKTDTGRVVGETNKTGAGSSAVTDDAVWGDTDGGSFALTLPAGASGQRQRYRNTGGSGNALTLNRAGGDTVDGGTSLVLYDGETADMIFNSTDSNWEI